MRRVLTGQSLLILCCFFYLIWWYRGYRPGIPSERVGGLNGILLLFTAALGVAGFIFSAARIPGIKESKIYPTAIVIIIGTAAIVPHNVMADSLMVEIS